jgi:hypothetical protein
MTGLPAAPNRRAALAWVALQDAPTPTTIDITADNDFPYLAFTVATAAAVDTWAKLIGAKPHMGRPLGSGRSIYDATTDLAGWRVIVRAHLTPERVEDLDSEPREQLQQLVDQPEAHSGGVQ